MLRPPGLFAVVLLLLMTPLAVMGQNAQSAQPPLNWVPQGFEVLGQRAAFHTDFTFDRSMLQVASYFVGDADPECARRDRQVERHFGTQLSLCFAGPL